MSDIVLQTVIRFLAPFMQVYGLYLILWGHNSPGGAFAGGAIIAVSFLLGLLTPGPQSRFLAWRQIVQWLAALGGMAFLTLGMAGILQGTAFLTNFLGQGQMLFSAGFIPLLAASMGLLVFTAVFSLVAQLLEEDKNV